MLLGGRGEMEPGTKSKKKLKTREEKGERDPIVIALLGKKPVLRMILVLIAS